MRVPDPKANTTTEAYLAYKAGYLEESELKPKLYKPDLHFDGWLAYWAGLTITYPNKGAGGKNLAYTGWAQDFVDRIGTTVDAKLETVDGRSCVWWKANAGYGSYDTKYIFKTDFKENTQYTVSFDVKPSETFSNICFEYTDGTTSGNLGGLTSNVWQHITMTSTADKTLKNIHAFFNSGGVDVDLDTFMVEEGSSASSYEPYYAIPEMLCDEEALVAYLSGVTNTYPEEIKDPYDVRIVGYLKYLVSARWGRPAYPVNNEEFYLSTMDAPHTSNETPSADIELDTSEGKLIDVKAYGDTSQQTYSGKNLFSGDYAQFDSTGGTGSTYDYFKLPSEGQYSIKITARRDVASSTNYLGFSVNGGDSGGGVGVKWIYAGASTGAISAGDSIFITNLLDNVYIQYVSLYPKNETALQWFMDNFEIQLEKGVSTDYEPYCGGIPSPNPDYPQPIQVVTGEQMVTVTGKNLFNTVNRTQTRISIDCGTLNNRVTVNGTATRNNFSGSYWNINGTDNAGANYYNYDNTTSGTTLPAGTYTLSINNVSGSYITPNRVQIFVCSVYSGSYPLATLATITLTNNQTSATFTLAEETTVKIQLRVEVSSDTSVAVPVFDNYSFELQLEKGSTATSYQSYQSQDYTVDLGSIELCKIGTYQDYIYKSGDDWYVHKETTKLVLNGSETWALPNRDKYRYPFGFDVLDRPAGYYGVMCDTYTFSESGENDEAFKDYFTCRGQYSGPRLYFMTPRTAIEGSTYDAIIAFFKTFLSNHITTVYYTLTTPTDTQITDATLVGQLEALAGADTYNEKTYIKVTATDPNLPALLKVEAYKY